MLQIQDPQTVLSTVLGETFDSIQQQLETHKPALGIREIGTVEYASHGIARISGLFGVESEEVVTFENGLEGMAFNLDVNEVGVILLGDGDSLYAGGEVCRTGRVMDVPVGVALLGRVVDAVGNPLDELGPIHTNQRLPIERPAPPIMHRVSVTVPLQTGIKVIDALLPIGRGQRELILGDRQTGKSAIALDAIINQKESDVVCVYCVVGQRNAAVAKLIDDLRQHDALSYTTVVVASGEDAPGLQYIAPYAATSIAESFLMSGQDVLIVYDDLTHHARAYRELSLLLRRPPGREAYPGDIFYIHSRLLERSTHLRAEFGGGSLTALPIIETQAQDMSAYIPTNLISITDGQIYLSPDLMRKGMLPAVDVGKSVSRVGGKAQLPAYRSVAGDTRLTYAQFEELEIFSRLSTRLDDETRRTLARGRRLREILKQPQYRPITVFAQITALLVVTQGVLDRFPIEKVEEAIEGVLQAVQSDLAELGQRIEAGGSLDEADCDIILQTARHALGPVSTKLE